MRCTGEGGHGIEELDSRSGRRDSDSDARVRSWWRRWRPWRRRWIPRWRRVPQRWRVPWRERVPRWRRIPWRRRVPWWRRVPWRARIPRAWPLRPIPPIRLLRRFWIPGACRRLRFRSLLLGSLLVPSPVPGLHVCSTACDPAGARRVRAAGGPTRDNVLVLLCREQWLLSIHTAVPRRLAKGPDDSDELMALMKEGTHAYAHDLLDDPDPGRRWNRRSRGAQARDGRSENSLRSRCHAQPQPEPVQSEPVGTRTG